MNVIEGDLDVFKFRQIAIEARSLLPKSEGSFAGPFLNREFV
jgi:hypothetical protein